MLLLEMVYIKPKICDDSENIELCVLTEKDLFALNYEIKNAIDEQKAIQKRIDKYAQWNKSKINKLWPKFVKLAKVQYNIMQIEDAIREYITIKTDVNYEELLQIIQKGEIASKVVRELGMKTKDMSPTQIADLISGRTSQGKFINAFGKKGIVTKNIQKAFATAIIESIAEDSKRVKVLNKQFDLDIETIERNLETSKISYDSQIKSMEDQLELFKELQTRTVDKISEELIVELDLLKNILEPDTIKLVIQYVNLYSIFLKEINELSKQTPIETNAAKLITFLSKTDKLDVTSYVDSEMKIVNKKKKELQQQYDAWEKYKTEIQIIMYKLGSSSAEVVTDAISTIYNDIVKLKPSIDVENVKQEAAVRNKADTLRSQLAQAKVFLDQGTLTQEDYDKFKTLITKQLTGMNYDLEGLDIFESMATKAAEMQKRKGEITKSSEKSELEAYRDEKSNESEYYIQEFYDNVGDLNTINKLVVFLDKFILSFEFILTAAYEQNEKFYKTDDKYKIKVETAATTLLKLKEELSFKQVVLLGKITLQSKDFDDPDIKSKYPMIEAFFESMAKIGETLREYIGNTIGNVATHLEYNRQKLSSIFKKTETAKVDLAINELLGNRSNKVILTIDQMMEELPQDLLNGYMEKLTEVKELYDEAKQKSGISDTKKYEENGKISKVINEIFTQAHSDLFSSKFGKRRVNTTPKKIRRRSNNAHKKKKKDNTSFGTATNGRDTSTPFGGTIGDAAPNRRRSNKRKTRRRYIRRSIKTRK